MLRTALLALPVLACFVVATEPGVAPPLGQFPPQPEGTRTQIDAKEWNFALTRARAVKAIEPIWKRRASAAPTFMVKPGTYTTRINLVIATNGSFVSAEVAKTCGIAVWDHAALDAAKEASPFRSASPTVIASDGNIHLGDLGFTIQMNR